MKNKFLYLLYAFSALAAATQFPDEVVVTSGKYYVGNVFGQHDYAAHNNITLSSFRIMRTEVTYRFYSDIHQWALERGYEFGVGCNGATFEDCLSSNTDKGTHPVTNVEWSDAVIFANALSEKVGLRPVYLTKKGVPARSSFCYEFTQDPRADGYRLPTAEEWQVAARGGKAGLDWTMASMVSSSLAATTLKLSPGIQTLTILTSALPVWEVCSLTRSVYTT